MQTFRPDTHIKYKHMHTFRKKKGCSNSVETEKNEISVCSDTSHAVRNNEGEKWRNKRVQNFLRTRHAMKPLAMYTLCAFTTYTKQTGFIHETLKSSKTI